MCTVRYTIYPRRLHPRGLPIYRRPHSPVTDLGGSIVDRIRVRSELKPTRVGVEPRFRRLWRGGHWFEGSK